MDKAISRRAFLGIAATATSGAAIAFVVNREHNNPTNENLEDVKKTIDYEYFVNSFKAINTSSLTTQWTMAPETKAMRKGDTLYVGYDGRIFSDLTKLYVYKETRYLNTIDLTEVSRTAGIIYLKGALPDDLNFKAGDISFAPNYLCGVNYPYDSIDSNVGQSIISSNNRQEISSAPIKSTTAISHAWGTQLACAWNQGYTVNNKEYSYYHPRSIVIKSTGPSSTPLGYKLQINLDGEIVQDITAFKASIKDSALSTSQVSIAEKLVKKIYQVTVQVNIELTAGQEILLDFGYKYSNKSVNPKIVSHIQSIKPITKHARTVPETYIMYGATGV
ncbi:MAG: hypothetical protein QM571_03460 [Micrococcaceae bacterium]